MSRKTEDGSKKDFGMPVKFGGIIELRNESEDRRPKSEGKKIVVYPLNLGE